LARGGGEIDVDAGPAFLIELANGREIEIPGPPTWVRRDSAGVRAAYARAWSQPVNVGLDCRLAYADRAAQEQHAREHAEAARRAAEEQQRREEQARTEAAARAKAEAEAVALRERTRPAHEAHLAEMTRTNGSLADVRKRRAAVEGERWRADRRLHTLNQSASDLLAPGLLRTCLVLGAVVSVFQLLLVGIAALVPGPNGIALVLFVTLSVAVTLVLVGHELRSRVGTTPPDELVLPYGFREHSRVSTWAEDAGPFGLVSAVVSIVVLQLIVGAVLRAHVLVGWQAAHAGVLHLLIEALIVAAAVVAFLRTRSRIGDDRARAVSERAQLQSQVEEVDDLIARFRCGQPGCPFCAVM
jgi:hypothetical protein